jgi:hypothetical protein
LDGDVVGAAVKVRLEPGGDLVGRAVQYEGVDQSVASTVVDVVVGVAVAARV